MLPATITGFSTAPLTAEIVAGGTVYRLPRPPMGVTRRSECPADRSELSDEARAFCEGDLEQVWDAEDVNGSLAGSRADGFCAVADVLGADPDTATGPANPLDGVPEVLTVDGGWVHVFDGQNGTLRFEQDLDAGAEVVYNDECFFRVFDGLDGRVWFSERAPSRTRTEHPVIADVDNDGNAEIVFATSNESGFCDDPPGAGGNDFNNGIEVWGDQADTWVPARRIWNQHAYHVTNVLESGGLPRRAPESWRR